MTFGLRGGKERIMEQIMNYVKPELIVVAVGVFPIGKGLEKAGGVPGEYIPPLLRGEGVGLCAGGGRGARGGARGGGGVWGGK